MKILAAISPHFNAKPSIDLLIPHSQAKPSSVIHDFFILLRPRRNSFFMFVGNPKTAIAITFSMIFSMFCFITVCYFVFWSRVKYKARF